VGVCERQPRTLAVFSRMLVSMIGRERGGGKGKLHDRLPSAVSCGP